MSHASARLAPPPAAAPLTAAMTGLGADAIAAIALAPLPTSSRACAQSCVSISCFKYPTSAPAQNARPAPVRTMTRQWPSRAASRIACPRSAASRASNEFSASGRFSVIVGDMRVALDEEWQMSRGRLISTSGVRLLGGVSGGTTISAVNEFVSIDGARLEYVWHGPSPAHAPTLVFLHEGLGSHQPVARLSRRTVLADRVRRPGVQPPGPRQVGFVHGPALRPLPAR